MRSTSVTSRSRAFVAVALAPCLVTSALAFQAPKPKPKPEPPKSDKKVEKKPVSPKLSPLVIETDLACTVTVDGDDRGELPVNGTLKLELPLGEHVLRAVSKDDPSVVWRKVIDVSSEARRAAVIELAPMLRQLKADQTDQQKRDAAEAARQRDDARKTEAENRRSALIQKLTGFWTGGQDWDGKFTDNNAPYHGKNTLRMTIGQISGRLIAKYSEHRVLTPASGMQFMQDQEADIEISLTPDGSGFSGQIVRARMRENAAEFSDLTGAQLTNLEFGSGRFDRNLYVSIEWRNGTTTTATLVK